MRASRRQFLQMGLGAAALPACVGLAGAQTFPSRPMRIVVPAAPGGASDILARIIGEWLSERLRQPLTVENRGGAGGNLATEAVVRSAPDGHTLLLVASSHAINATLYDKLSFNFLRDIAPVASFVRQAHVLVVTPSLPVTTVPEFIAYAKANPPTMGSAGIGTGPHMTGELFRMMAGIDMTHVPYRGGGPALGDLIGGQLQVMFPALGVAMPHIRAGTLRPLAVTTAERSATLPDVPAVAEFLPGYEATSVFGLGAPKGTPVDIVDRLNREVNAALEVPRIRSRLDDLGGGVFPSLPGDFGSLLTAETEKWGRVVRFSGAQPG